MKGHGAYDDMPDGDARCRDCGEQYCDSYDSGDPVHKKCVGDPGAGSAIELPGERGMKGVKVVRWGLKSPEGWLVEGARGLFTHSKDVRKATRYGKPSEAKQAVKRAGHSVAVDAVTIERIRVSVDPNDGPGEIKCAGCGHVRTTEKKFPTLNALWKELVKCGWVPLEESGLIHCKSCTRKAEKWRRFVLHVPGKSGGWLVALGVDSDKFRVTPVKEDATRYGPYELARAARMRALGSEKFPAVGIDHLYETGELYVYGTEEHHDEDRGPSAPPYYVIAKGKVPERLYLAALPLTDRAPWTKIHEHAIHYSTYERAVDTLEKMASEDRGGGLHAATVEHIYVEEAKRSETPLPPPRAGDSSHGPAVPLHWVVETMLRHRRRFLKVERCGSEERPRFVKDVDRASRFSSEAEAKKHSARIAGSKATPIYMTVVPENMRRLEFTCSCRAAISFDLKKKTRKVKCPACSRVYPLTRAPLGPGEGIRFGARVVHAFDDEECRRLGIGHVAAVDETVLDGRPIKVRWSQFPSSGPPEDDTVAFHEPRELQVVYYPDTGEIPVVRGRRVMVLETSDGEPIELSLEPKDEDDGEDLAWLEKDKARKLSIAFPGVSSCPSIFDGHACLLGKGGKHELPHAWWDEEGAIDLETEENLSRIEWDAEGRIVAPCLKCMKKIPREAMAKNLCASCYGEMRSSSTGSGDTAKSKKLFNLMLTQLPEDPQVRLPRHVLKGLRVIRRGLKGLTKSGAVKWPSEQNRKAVAHALVWIRAISRVLEKPKKSKDQQIDDALETIEAEEKDRAYYHKMLDQAMDRTKERESFLPEFTKLVIGDMIDLGPTESGR